MRGAGWERCSLSDELIAGGGKAAVPRVTMTLAVQSVDAAAQ